MASLIDCCGVKGYTLNTASASQLRMIAKSVVKTKLLILRPLMIMSLAWDTAVGSHNIFLRNYPPISGIALISIICMISYEYVLSI